MSSINKIKLPNGTTYDVNDVRIPGIDSTPTSGSSNVVTSGGIYTGLSGKADKSATVSTVTYDTTNKKITKTINGTTTDVVTASTLVTDGGGIKNVKTVNNNSLVGTGNISVGTVTSVSAGTGLSIGGTASTTPTVNIASGYKLPTTTEWNAKAPLASPALTGTPTAPTAAAGTNTTQIATTAFVKNAVDSALTSSENLKTEQKTNQEIVFRKTNVDWEAKAAKLTKILGRTEAFNQQINAETSIFNECTITKNADGSYTVSGSGASARYKTLSAINFGGAGHNIFLYFKIISGSGVAIYDSRNLDEAGGYMNTDQSKVYTQSTAGVIVLIRSANAADDCTFRIILVDLTLEGLGLTTADQFRALHPLPYYNYNAGVLKNNAATGLETTGFNQWDEVWEVGSITSTDGSKVSSTTQIRSKNYIPVLPNTTYYRKNPYSDNGAGHLNRAAFYDANKQYLGIGSTGGWIAFDGNGTFTTPANAAYMLFYVNITSYGHDICINLSDASRNGTYEPYWKREIVLGLDNLPCHDENNNAVVVNGLDGVGTSQDELIVENGWGTKINKRFAEVDLGTLEWVLNETYGFIATPFPKPKTAFSAICEKYPFMGSYTRVVDKTCGYIFNTGILVKDSAYTDAATFKAAMAGVKLRYQLATPKVLTLDNPIPALIEADNLGTEKRLPEDTADNPQAPFECDIQYGINSADIVNSISYLDKKAENIFWTTYDSTTYSDIVTAINAGKLVLMSYEPDSTHKYILTATYYEHLPVQVNTPYVRFNAAVDGGMITTRVWHSDTWDDIYTYDFGAPDGSVPAGRYSCVKSSGSGITSAFCCNGNIIIDGSAGTYGVTLSNFYESFTKSIGGYSLTKASQSDADKVDELAFLMSNSYIIKEPAGTGFPFTRYSNSYQLAAYGSGTKIISFTFGESTNGTRLLVDSNGVTITLA